MPTHNSSVVPTWPLAGLKINLKKLLSRLTYFAPASFKTPLSTSQKSRISRMKWLETFEPRTFMGVGQVARELWWAPGSGIADLTSYANYQAGAPDSIENLSSLEFNDWYWFNAGTRTTGYLLAPESGNYSFWLNGSASTDFYLSSDADPEHRNLLASVEAGVSTDQQSQTVWLEAGQRYYFEILQGRGESEGPDNHMSLSWANDVSINDFTLISGNNFESYDSPSFAPAFGVIILDAPTISDHGNGNFVTSQTPTLSGTLPNYGDNTQIELYSGSRILGTPTQTWTVSPGSGAFSFTFPAGALNANQTYTLRTVQSSGSTLVTSSMPVTFTPDWSIPTVDSLTLDANSPPGQVHYNLHFTKPVTGLYPGSFHLITTGSVTGAYISDISGGGDTYTIAINPGSGWGTLRLDLADDDSIQDAAGNKLGGTGQYNGDVEGDTLQPTLTHSGATNTVEGTPTSLTLGTTFYTLPSDTVWEIDWGDGTVDTDTGSNPGFTHSYTDGDGVYDVTYNAVDADGAALYSEFVPVTVLPAMPAGLSASTVMEDSVTLQWTADSDLATSYRIEVSQEGAAFTVVAEGVTRDGSTGFFVPPVTPSFVSGPFAERIYYGIGDLAVGTHYTFHVLATNAAGNSTVASLEVQTVDRQATSGTLHPRPESDPLPPSAAWAADLGFNINFYGLKARELLVVNNGKLTWAAYGLIPWQDEPDPAHAGFLMAPFYTPADNYHTNEMKGGNVTFGPETYDGPGEAHGRKSFAVHWNGVSFYNESWDGDPQVTGPNTFSAIIVERSDTGPGNFDIIYKYGDLNWDGQLTRTGGQTTLAYSPRAGYYNEQLSGSGENGGLLYLANTTVTKEVRNPQVLVVLDDLSPGGQGRTSWQKDMLGVNEDVNDVAHLRLKLLVTNPAPGSDYRYSVWGDNFGSVVDDEPIAPGGTVEFETHATGRYHVYVTSAVDSDFYETMTFYAGRLEINWNGADLWTGTNTPDTNFVPVHTGDHITDRTIDVFAGQRIKLGYSFDAAASQLLPAWRGALVESDIDGFYVSNNQKIGNILELSASSMINDELKFYAVNDAANRVFTLKLFATINGEQIMFSASTKINVHKPGQSIWHQASNFTFNAQQHPPEIAGSRLTDYIVFSAFAPGAPTDEKSRLTFVQLIESTRAYKNYFTENIVTTKDTRKYVLDTKYPYTTPNDVVGGTSDSPYENLETIKSEVWAFDFFKMWLMWTPSGNDSIAIPIQQIKWKWAAAAVWNFGTGWRINGAAFPNIAAGTRLNLSGTNVNDFPAWTSIW